MEHYPYTYRLTVLKRIQTPTFELGKGCVVLLNLASKQLLKLLRAVYHKDKFALGLSPASANYLLNEFGQNLTDFQTPCISVPNPICFQPKIVS